MVAGIMRTEFGRRESRALSNAMIKLVQEEALMNAVEETTLAERIRAWWRELRPGVAFGLVLIFVIGIGASLFWGDKLIRSKSVLAPVFVCSLCDTLDAHWAGDSPQPKVGDGLIAGPMHLESGVIEMTFASKARIAIEGPAQFVLTGPNDMELREGKLSTEVPKRARGFAVTTPTSKVVDLGTRFALNVKTDGASELDVFEGTVEATQAGIIKNAEGQWNLTQKMAMIFKNDGAVTATSLPETAFPQLSQTLVVKPENCGFDVSSSAVLGGFPTGLGYWSGPAYMITGPTEGINPAEGAGMLRFLDVSNQPSGDSPVWQLIDMRPVRQVLASGEVEARLSALFNQIRGDARNGGKFHLTLAAFHGQPSDAASLWLHKDETALALADKELVADNDPKTWEKLEVSEILPASTDFVVVEIRAVAPAGASFQAAFPGQFADLIDLQLDVAPLRASSTELDR